MSSSKDVIVAEDDADDLLFFEIAINETGIPVAIRHAKNGDSLFVLLKEQIPELLFLDVRMPCKDGVLCITEIRRHKEYDNLPVIMCTSSSYEKTIEDCYKSGANFYLVKPDNLNALTYKLKSVLSLSHQGSARPALSHFVI